MAVQQILGKQITKFDTEKLSKNPNFVQEEKPKIKEEVVHGNTIENSSKKVYQGDIKPSQNIYGERKHTYTPEPNGNLQMEQMMGKLMNKLDNFDSPSQTGTKAIEVDIKKEIAIGKVDMSAIKSEEVKGKVNNKLNKLKKLRKRNGR